MIRIYSMDDGPDISLALSKAIRVITVDDEEGAQEGGLNFAFVDENDEPVDAEVVLARFHDPLIIIIFSADDVAKLLRQLEMNRPFRDFIFHHNLWEKAFKRTFRMQYMLAFDPEVEPVHMKEQYQRELDALSANPNRFQTYWKRYYEFLSIRRPLPTTTKSHAKILLSKILETNMGVPYYSERGYEPTWRFRDVDLYRHREMSKNIVYFIPRVFWETQEDEDDSKIFDDTPKNMIEIDLNDMQWRTVPYDPQLLSRINFAKFKEPRWRSPDGFYFYEYFRKGGHNLGYIKAFRIYAYERGFARGFEYSKIPQWPPKQPGERPVRLVSNKFK